MQNSQPGARIPKVGEFVIAQIAKVMPFGAYCRLPEYNNLEVFLPLKEVSSGWIKNIREFIREGQTVVCLVIYHDREKNTIDVSIKKVPQSKAKEKIKQYNLEKRFVALFQQLLKSNKIEGQEAVQVNNQLVSEFGTYTNFAENVLSNTPEFVNSKIPKKIKDAFAASLEAMRKNRKYVVSYIAKVSTTNTVAGATELRSIMQKVSKIGVEVKYISAPMYRIISEGVDYNEAESKVKKAEELIREGLPDGTIELEKEKLKKEKESIFDI